MSAGLLVGAVGAGTFIADTIHNHWENRSNPLTSVTIAIKPGKRSRPGLWILM